MRLTACSNPTTNIFIVRKIEIALIHCMISPSLTIHDSRLMETTAIEEADGEFSPIMGPCME